MDRASIQERFGIIGSSPAIRNVIDRMRQVADTDITILIQGESGVGKELVAEACHALSTRRHEPLIIVNCGAIPEGLMESELFGAEKGAYTGAVEKRKGYFEEADGGTIFLDEIGEMPAAAQVRLLRVLESGEFSRVGSSTTKKTNVRILAATNKDLGREVEAGRFREDLYYRLSTVIITIPPLRERTKDIMPIFEHFVHRLSQKYNTPARQLTDAARQQLLDYHWPGNARELRNVAEQVVVLLQGEHVTAEDIRPYLRGVSAKNNTPSLMPVKQDNREEGSDREREFIYRALLELRMEMRELKEKVGQLASNVGVAVPREAMDRDQASNDQTDFVIVRSPDKEEYASFIKDVPYELEGEERSLPPYEGEATPASPQQQGEATAPEEPVDQEPSELPTLENAERQLIVEALQQFDGNRRQTAKALGISERTLYRKLKDIEADL